MGCDQVYRCHSCGKLIISRGKKEPEGCPYCKSKEIKFTGWICGGTIV